MRREAPPPDRPLAAWRADCTAGRAYRLRAPHEKLSLLLNWDKVLGLGINLITNNQLQITSYVGKQSGVQIGSQVALDEKMIDLIDQRELVREQKDWEQADKLRLEIENHKVCIEGS